MCAKIPSIVTSGRLGNQLFQWAYMHQIMRNDPINKRLTFSMIEMNSSTNGQTNRLLPLKHSCTHLHISKANLLLKLRMKIVERLNLTLPDELTAKIASVLGLEYESINYLNTNYSSKGSTRIGYYQDVRKFIDELSLLLSELIEAIEIETRNLLETGKFNGIMDTPFQLLHIRGGDFRDSGNENFGLLAKDYYLDNLDSRLKSIIITDDPIYAYSSITKFIPNSVILNPNEFNEWCALAISTMCDRFISSNSTFSYWCGLLANRHGATTLLPKPFNKIGVDLETLQLPHLEFVEAQYL